MKRDLCTIIETFAQLFWQAHDTNVSWAAGDRAVGRLKPKVAMYFWQRRLRRG